MRLRTGAMCLLLFIGGISLVGTSAQGGPAIECDGEAATVVGPIERSNLVASKGHGEELGLGWTI